MGHHVLAIDQGTTGTTCLVVEMSANATRVCSRGYAELTQHFPRPGWVEHDLGEIWQSTLSAIRTALAQSGVAGQQLAAISITNQRETTGVWDRDGKPCGRAIVWQDRRTAERCEALRRGGYTELVRERTGLVIDPYFSGTKLAWLLDEGGLRRRAAAGELRFGTIDTWLLWQLTGGRVHATDASNASRTMLYDLRRNIWDTELAEVLGGVPQALLPEVRSSSEVYGQTRGVPGLPDGIPIAGIAGDQQAALFGQACFAPGMAKCTYGTGAFALVNTGERVVRSERGLVSTVAWRRAGKTTYALEGSIFIAGAAVQWLRDGLGFFSTSAEVEALAASVPDSAGVIFVPALTGLGAPHWRAEARGLITGLTRGVTRAHLARATLEGIALQINDLLAAMRHDSGSALTLLRVDGGAAANDLLMQFQADLLGVSIHRPRVVETTALGSAYLAALAVGLFADLEAISKAWVLEREFVARPNEAIAEHVQRWRDALAKA